MKKAMCFGSFDLFHEGHKYFLNESAKYGSLYVVVARDSSIEKIKKRKLTFFEEKRVETIKNNIPSAKVLLGDKTDFYKIIREIKPDVICLGYDQVADEKYLRKNFPNIKIVRVNAYKPEVYKSSLIKKNLNNKVSN
ncbi:FAD synthase [Candidatus Pacearchaeota archaeon CG_4_10_14_0_2_um_filter_31_10]|nr:MAG: FAD synthase [Candidatus Pacearchaeota archaeon CG10_big_fil_rev_8_21_14_0_10_31_59]PIZ81118.1 MAG: FAD synthase [Candidatus Pacearchaeota archaeon CG_4_10_14_0_2_um_filter_31_10]